MWQILKFCICWQFWSKHLYASHQYLETVFEFTLLASMSHCSLNFECPSLGYGFLSIILVLEKCNSGPWKSLKSVWILYFEFAMNPGCSNSSIGTSFNWLHASIKRDEFKTMLINYFYEENELENSHKPSWNCAIPCWAVLQIDNRVLATKLHVLDCSIVHLCTLLTECCLLSA